MNKTALSLTVLLALSGCIYTAADGESSFQNDFSFEDFEGGGDAAQWSTPFAVEAVPWAVASHGDADIHFGDHALCNLEVQAGEVALTRTEVFFPQDGIVITWIWLNVDVDDDVVSLVVDGETKVNWTGSVDEWFSVGFEVEPGVHELAFEYRRGANSVSNGAIACIDNVTLLGGFFD